MKSAVLTVVYEEAEPYVIEFLASIQNQTTSNFELIIVNDGLSSIVDLVSKFSIKTRIMCFSGTFVSIRKQAIWWLANAGFEKVIFADADDYFDANRVEVTQSLLDGYDMVCNELVLFGSDIKENISMLSQRFFSGQTITKDDLMDGNLMGMSNTGIRLKPVLPVIGQIPDDIVAMDWLLYTKSFLLGNSCIFTNETKTYYRQHLNNIASPVNYTDGQITRAINIKLQHYSHLQNDGEVYRKKAAGYKHLLALLGNKDFRDEYFDTVRRNIPPCPLWWEAIKIDEES